jgi:hypothetical protein
MPGCATGIGIPLVAVTVTPVLISDPAMASDPDGPCRIAPARAAAATTALPPMMAKGLMRLVLIVSMSLSVLSDCSLKRISRSHYSVLRGRSLSTGCSSHPAQPDDELTLFVRKLRCLSKSAQPSDESDRGTAHPELPDRSRFRNTGQARVT